MVLMSQDDTGGMSKKGNAVLSSSVSTAATSTNSRNATTASVSKETATAARRAADTNPAAATRSNTTTTKSSSSPGCKKCLQEEQVGQKNNLRHSADCPKKKASKRPSSIGNDDGNLCKKKSKPTEPIYVNKNPIRRTSLLGGGIDADLISSIHSTRPDLTGGSGLGVGGFELSSARVTATNTSKGFSTRRVITQRSDSDISCNEKPPRATARKSTGSDILDLDYTEAAIERANKAASLAATQASRAANEVIVLDDSDDEDTLIRKPPAALKQKSTDVEVIEID